MKLQMRNGCSRLREDSHGAVKDLQQIVRAAVSSFELSVEDKEDCVQTTIERVLSKLYSFRNKSKFSSWVVAIAVNNALNLVRKKRWDTVSLDQIDQSVLFKEDAMDTRFEYRSLLEEVERMIESELTPKQRTALLAELGSMPLLEIARKMNTSRGAIYKLTHDARKNCCQNEKQSIDLVDVLQSVD